MTADFVLLSTDHHKWFKFVFLSVSGTTAFFLRLMFELFFSLFYFLLISFELCLGHFVVCNLIGVNKSMRVVQLFRFIFFLIFV